MRDRIVYRICNFLIYHFASEDYRMGLWVVYSLGMRELKRLDGLRVENATVLDDDLINSLPEDRHA